MHQERAAQKRAYRGSKFCAGVDKRISASALLLRKFCKDARIARIGYGLAHTQQKKGKVQADKTRCQARQNRCAQL